MKQRMLTLSVVSLVMVVLWGSLVLVKTKQDGRSGAAYAPAETMILPDRAQLVVGEEITVVAAVNSGDEYLSGADLIINYDKDRLEIEEVVADKDDLIGSQYYSDNSEVVVNNIYQNEGKIRFSTINWGAEEKLTKGVSRLVRIKMKAIGEGKAKITVSGDSQLIGYQANGDDQGLLISKTYPGEYEILRGNTDCTEWWWFDNNTRQCGKKTFCGLYQYEGLRLFGTEEECLTELASTGEPGPIGSSDAVRLNLKTDSKTGIFKLGETVGVNLNMESGSKEVASLILALKYDGEILTMVENDLEIDGRYEEVGREINGDEGILRLELRPKEGKDRAKGSWAPVKLKFRTVRNGVAQIGFESGNKVSVGTEDGEKEANFQSGELLLRVMGTVNRVPSGIRSY